MRILVLTAAPALPQMVGGSQRTSHALIQGLIARGHHVELLAGLRGPGWVGIRSRALCRLTGKAAAPDRALGYRVWRSWKPWDAVAEVSASVRPDVALVLAHKPTVMAKAAISANVRVLLALQDVEFKDQGDDYESLTHVPGVANSQFTADRYSARFGIVSSVVHPIVKPASYAVEPTGRQVTFVTPDARKGLEIAIAIARACPHIPFLFVDGWPIDPEKRERLVDRLAAFGNITYSRAVADMRDIYRQTRILLVPSMWEEGYGRVATEAQISGIPVIGSSRGGLPEAIGTGGIILDADGPIDAWVEAVNTTWSDDERYRRLSGAALAYAGRPEMRVDLQIAQWEAALLSAGRG